MFYFILTLYLLLVIVIIINLIKTLLITKF